MISLLTVTTITITKKQGNKYFHFLLEVNKIIKIAFLIPIYSHEF